VINADRLKELKEAMQAARDVVARIDKCSVIIK